MQYDIPYIDKVKAVICFVAPIVFTIALLLQSIVLQAMSLVVFTLFYAAMFVVAILAAWYIERVILPNSPYKHIVGAMVGWSTLTIALFITMMKIVEIPDVKAAMEGFLVYIAIGIAVLGLGVALVLFLVVDNRFATTVDIERAEKYMRQGKICKTELDLDKSMSTQFFIVLTIFIILTVISYIMFGIFSKYTLYFGAASAFTFLVIGPSIVGEYSGSRDRYRCYDREDLWLPFVRWGTIIGLVVAAIMLAMSEYAAALGFQQFELFIGITSFAVLMITILVYFAARYP